ncbi:coiled-coil domain-containing protein AGAP005037 isoform X5 [Folsomia candida]|uniref:coiled-coil domain-containing protein AGAP005037 isoform X5 n=1 Tax=Folsomia candida TaxID=158441 RepID=UPI00160534F8|nr:coiled-coil domain-containing protein AGAP005037 isoform X5 [Folsomia candida]
MWCAVLLFYDDNSIIYPSSSLYKEPPASKLNVRHAKCLQPASDSSPLRQLNGVDKWKQQTTKENYLESPKTKFAPLVQIRSLPLCLSQLRSSTRPMIKGHGENTLQRSSYVVNTKNEKVQVKRARSLSPVILRTTAVEPLTSPNLVRSSSFPKKNGRKRFLGSFIPIRSTYTSISRECRHQRQRTPTPTPAVLSSSPVPNPATSKCQRPPPSLSPRHRVFDGSSTSCGVVVEGKVKIVAITNKSPGVRNHQEKVPVQPTDDELGGIIPSHGRRKTHARPTFGSQLLGGGVAGAAGGGSGRQSDTSANGLPRATRRMKMDMMNSPPPPPKHLGGSGGTSRMISTKSAAIVQPPVYSHTIYRKLSPDYPMYTYHYKSPSISSSIYSEPIHARSSYKQGVFSQRSAFGRPQPPHPSSAMFDEADDPGIMSEAETASTGFRRGGKARSSLPVVRTPSKTLERPLGLVFLQYRTETKRALLPNEVTSLDTVKALFVRSFPRQLSMEYLDAMNVKIYIHDGSKDMFYELEDLRDVRDRSVMRLVNGKDTWDQDQSYFSEPEFESEYQHQHIHKTKGSKAPPYMTYSYPIGATNSLPRVNRPFSPAPVAMKSTVLADSALYSPRTTGTTQGTAFPMPPSGYITPDLRRNIYSSGAEPTYVSSPERRCVEDPYYSQFPQTRSGSITPVIIDDEARFRMEHMERQLANLTGLVQKALVHPPVPTPPTRLVHSSPLPRTIPGAIITPPTQNTYRDYIPTRDYRDDIDKHSSSSSSLPDDPVRPIAENHIPSNATTHTKAPKFGKVSSRTVSFDLSFSEDPPEHGKQHSPSQYSDRVLKPVPATAATGVPKQIVLPAQPALVNIPSHHDNRQYYSGPRGELCLNPEMFNQLRNLQKKARELKSEIRVLRRNVQVQAHSVRETIKDTFLKFKVAAMAGNDQWMQGDPEKARIHRGIHKEKEYYKQEMLKLDNDLEELETTVEILRGHVITKRTRVNMSDVENMALVLSKASKSVADLKTRFPSLQESVKTLLTNEMDAMMVEERFLKEEPERLEVALRRCKKLTGTLVTLKRLASVQEQRLPSQDGESSPGTSPPGGGTPNSSKMNNRGATTGSVPGYGFLNASGNVMGPGINYATGTAVGPENALDDLLNELDGAHQIGTYKQHRLEPPKRLPSYPSTESGSPVRSPLRPPLLPKPARIPPPPPPRTSSKSPLISPSIESSGGDSSESINSQDAGSNKLSQRHQELLRKQQQLQAQYNRLQVLQQRSVSSTGSNSPAENNKLELKKTGSESNLRAKLGLEFSAAPTGSLSNINKSVLYETDIL